MYTGAHSYDLTSYANGCKSILELRPFIFAGSSQNHDEEEKGIIMGPSWGYSIDQLDQPIELLSTGLFQYDMVLFSHMGLLSLFLFRISMFLISAFFLHFSFFGAPLLLLCRNTVRLNYGAFHCDLSM